MHYRPDNMNMVSLQASLCVIHIIYCIRQQQLIYIYIYTYITVNILLVIYTLLYNIDPSLYKYMRIYINNTR